MLSITKDPAVWHWTNVRCLLAPSNQVAWQRHLERGYFAREGILEMERLPAECVRAPVLSVWAASWVGIGCPTPACHKVWQSTSFQPWWVYGGGVVSGPRYVNSKLLRIRFLVFSRYFFFAFSSSFTFFLNKFRFSRCFVSFFLNKCACFVCG